VLALDEPDAHLHPSALRRFMNLLHLPGKNHSILLATHSNNLLEELKSPAESIRIVDSTSKGTRVRQLDSEALATWRQEYTLPELRRTGLLDHANSEYGKDE
jgi:predicted ATPase